MMEEDDEPAVNKYFNLWKKNGWIPPAVNHDEERDFLGYGRNVPNISWPGNKRVAVSFVLNFEEGSEFSIGDGDDHNEGIYEVIDCEEGARDFCIESHFEYGTRVGYWRVVDAFERYKAKMTVSSCGRAVERSPWLVKDAALRGHEIAGHGYRWQTHAKMSEDEEREAINKCVEAIREAIGKPPVGWHTRSERSFSTRKLLIERGFIYSDDAYNDETPYFVKVGDDLHLILPYAFDTNDMQFQNTNRFNTSASFATYVCDSFDWLLLRESNIPRMMTIGLHLRMITRPGRMLALERILDHITKSGKAWIATREEMARHWLKRLSVDALASGRILSVPNLPLNQSQSKDQMVHTGPFNLLIINPNTSPAATQLILSHVQRIVPNHVNIATATATIGSATICSEVSFAAASFAVVETYRNYANTAGAMQPDAIMVGCFGDPGVFSLREYLTENGLSKIPVLGLAEASMRKAAELPGKFAIITGGAAWGPILTRLAKSLDLKGCLSEVHTVAPNGAQLAANRPAAIALLKESCVQAIISANGKAESFSERCSCVILGGALLAGMSSDISEVEIGVPVIDSVTAGVEMIVRALNSEAFRSLLS